jgi:hypothetical protein
MKTISIFSLLMIQSMLYAYEDPEIKNIDPFFYAHMNFQRDWSYVSEARDIFLKECLKQHIRPENSDSLFLIVYNGEIPVWGLGFKVNDTIVTKPPVKKSRYDYDLIAKYTFTGFDKDIYNSVQHFRVDINSQKYVNNGPMIIAWPTKSYSTSSGINQHEITWPVKIIKKGKILADNLNRLISFLIIFQFLFIGIYLITHRGRSLSNVLFAVVLFSNALVLLNDIFYSYMSAILQFSPHVFEAGNSFVFLVPPALYFYTISILYSDFKFTKSHVIHLIPFVLHLIFVSIKFHFISADLKKEL